MIPTTNPRNQTVIQLPNDLSLRKWFLFLFSFLLLFFFYHYRQTNFITAKKATFLFGHKLIKQHNKKLENKHQKSITYLNKENLLQTNKSRTYFFLYFFYNTYKHKHKHLLTDLTDLKHYIKSNWIYHCDRYIDIYTYI